MVKEDRSTWKAKYTMRLTQNLDEYPKVFIVGADNVGSRQMQKKFVYRFVVMLLL